MPALPLPPAQRAQPGPHARARAPGDGRRSGPCHCSQIICLTISASLFSLESLMVDGAAMRPKKPSCRALPCSAIFLFDHSFSLSAARAASRARRTGSGTRPSRVNLLSRILASSGVAPQTRTKTSWPVLRQTPWRSPSLR